MYLSVNVYYIQMFQKLEESSDDQVDTEIDKQTEVTMETEVTDKGEVTEETQVTEEFEVTKETEVTKEPDVTKETESKNVKESGEKVHDESVEIIEETTGEISSDIQDTIDEIFGQSDTEGITLVSHYTQGITLPSNYSMLNMSTFHFINTRYILFSETVTIMEKAERNKKVVTVLKQQVLTFDLSLTFQCNCQPLTRRC